MRRIRLRTIMILIALLAVILGTGLGIRRREQRLEALARYYGRKANRLETLWVEGGPHSEDRANQLMEQVHWNDSVANAYRIAADQPWMPFDPEPDRIVCRCSHHQAR